MYFILLKGLLKRPHLDNIWHPRLVECVPRKIPGKVSSRSGQDRCYISSLFPPIDPSFLPLLLSSHAKLSHLSRYRLSQRSFTLKATLPRHSLQNPTRHFGPSSQAPCPSLLLSIPHRLQGTVPFHVHPPFVITPAASLLQGSPSQI